MEKSGRKKLENRKSDFQFSSIWLENPRTCAKIDDYRHDDLQLQRRRREAAAFAHRRIKALVG